MKWQIAVIIIFILGLSGYIYHKSTINNLRDQWEINSLKSQLDSLKNHTNEATKEHTERIFNNTRIVEKWNEIHDTIINRDNLLVECKKDINFLDTSLKKCDYALKSCIYLSGQQDEIIKRLESKKTPFIIPYAGVGLSIDKSFIVSPSFQTGVGINLNKIFGRK